MGMAPAPGESDVERQRRATIFELLGTIGADDDARSKAREIHTTFVAAPDGTDPEMVSAALNVIAESGTPEEFRTFVDQWRTVDNPQEQLRYLYALPRFHHDDTYNEVLELSITEVRTQNAPFVVARALLNDSHGNVGWEWVRKNWSTLLERFPASTIVRMVEGTRWLVDAALDIEGFFAEHSVPQGKKTLAQHLERLRVNVALHEREHERLATAVTH
jgi:hypothetical protein